MGFEKGNDVGKQFEDGNTVARKHGAYALQKRGPASLDVDGIERFSQLRQLVRSHPERIELRQELAARAELIAEMLFAYLQEQVGDGTPIVEAKGLSMVGYWIGLANRILSDLPEDDGQPANVLEALRNGD